MESAITMAAENDAPKATAAATRAWPKAIPATIAAEKRNDTASKKNAKDVGYRERTAANGIHDGMLVAARRSAPNTAPAIGSVPYDDPRISPLASSSDPLGANSGTLASRAGR